MLIPTKEECIKILDENNTLNNIILHSKKVHEVAMRIVDILEKNGINVNRDLVGAAALLHDIQKIKEHHEIAGAELVKNMGFNEVASIIKKHGLRNIEDENFTPSKIEEKIVFYADKRVNGDKIVSLKQRFDYIKERYEYSNIDKEYQFAKKIEKELIGDNEV